MCSAKTEGYPDAWGEINKDWIEDINFTALIVFYPMWWKPCACLCCVVAHWFLCSHDYGFVVKELFWIISCLCEMKLHQFFQCQLTVTEFIVLNWFGIPVCNEPRLRCEQDPSLVCSTPLWWWALVLPRPMVPDAPEREFVCYLVLVCFKLLRQRVVQWVRSISSQLHLQDFFNIREI